MKKMFNLYLNNKKMVHLILLFIFLMIISFVFVYTNFKKDIELENDIAILM